MSNSEAILANLAREINEHESSRRACEVKGLMHGFRIGQLLLKAKAVTPHGKFLDWAKANTSVTPRMCQFYMHAARSPRLQWAIQHEYEAISHLSLTAAIELDRPPKAKEEKARRAMAEGIAKKWEINRETRRDFVRCLAEAKQGLELDGEGFRRFLVENACVGPAFADKIPVLLDHEYDDDAWTNAMLDDIEARLAELEAGQ